MSNEPSAEEVRRLYQELGKLSVIWCFKKGPPITMEGLLKEKETLAKLLESNEERVLELYSFLLQESQKLRLSSKKPPRVIGFFKHLLHLDN